MVGQGGILGVRLIRKGGIILWLRDKYQCDILIPYVGREVFIEDTIDKLIVFESGFDAKNRLLRGKWLCSIHV